MDVFGMFIVISIVFILFTICGWCCQRKREGTVFSRPEDIIVSPNYTTNAPYPVQTQAPSYSAYPGQNNPPPIGFAPQPYHCMPEAYPPQPASHITPSVPMPIPIGNVAQGATAPYPPAVPPYPVAPSAIPPNVKLPTYQEATATTTNELYAKQAPYNPNY